MGYKNDAKEKLFMHQELKRNLLQQKKNFQK